jgi:hypothetical protein
VGTTAGLNDFGENISYYQPGFESWVVQPAARRYTGYVISAVLQTDRNNKEWFFTPNLYILAHCKSNYASLVRL